MTPSPKRPLRACDIAHAYGYAHRDSAVRLMEGDRVTVFGLLGNDMFVVSDAKGLQWRLHRRQLRRLRPKAKPVAREWMLARSPRTGGWLVMPRDYRPSLDEPPAEAVRVREVLADDVKKEKAK